MKMRKYERSLHRSIYLLGPAHSSGHPNDPWPRQMYYAHSFVVGIGITGQHALSKGQCLNLVINNIAFINLIPNIEACKERVWIA